MIKALNGKDKSRIQYKRNSTLGSIAMCICHLNNVRNRGILDIEEQSLLDESLNQLHALDWMMRFKKGSKIEIVKTV